MKRFLGSLILFTGIVAVLVFLSHPLQASGKVTVCHNPSTPNQKTLEIGEESLADHLGHGDLDGPCAPLQETIAYVCSTSDIAYKTLYVSSEAWGAQRGTVERPFSSVSTALKYAEKMNLPGVELQIKPGLYENDMAMLSRPTRIVGPGQNANPSAELPLSIINNGAHELGVQGVVFRAAGFSPAITVSDLAADTALCDVRFESVVGHALRQTGGTLHIEGGIFNSTARNPKAGSDDHLTGTAMVLDGGIMGSINNTHVDGSSGSGLHVSGAGTRIDIDWDGSSQSVFENGSGCLGAVVVTSGAELNANRLTLDGNGLRGVSAEGSGTTVDLPFLTATSTKLLQGGLDVTGETCGFGAVSNVYAASNAAVNISGTSDDPFTISDSALAGFIIFYPISLSLDRGTINNNPIGMSVEGGGYCDDPAWSIENVLWINNIVDFDGPNICPPEPLREFACTNGVDDDQDGDIDCADSDCSGAPACSSP